VTVLQHSAVVFLYNSFEKLRNDSVSNLTYADKLTTVFHVFFYIYIHGYVHRESDLITVQQEATYSVYYISVGSSTCFRC
jgi:hypothetical protein